MPRDASNTRKNLIQAARDEFAKQGYERSTVRAIATAANVHPSLINRYFGGKEQLFAEAVAVNLAFPPLDDVPKEQVGEMLVSHFFRRWEGDFSNDILQVLVRTAATNEQAGLRIRAILYEQVEALVIALIGNKDARKRSGLIATQMLGLAYCRYVLGLSETDLPANLATKVIGGTIQRYLFEDWGNSVADPVPS